MDGFVEVTDPPECMFCGEPTMDHCPETHRYFSRGYRAGARSTNAMRDYQEAKG